MIAESKIEIQHVPASANQDGVERTKVLLRGTVKLEVLQPAARGGDDDDPNVSRSGPSAYEDASSRRFECDVDPEDPCATQSDRDDVLAEAVLLDASLESYSDFLQSTYSECISEDLCYDELTKAVAKARADDRHQTPDGSKTSAADVADGCGWHDLAAFGGIAWGVSGVAGAVAITVSPEPVSKLGLWAVWGNAVAGVTSAIAGVGFAYDCWQSQRVYDPTEPPLARLTTPRLAVGVIPGATR